jgi:hypothetical protein
MAGSTRMSPEACYLFRLAGPAGTNGHSDAPGLSWDEVIRLAHREKAIPVLFEDRKRAGLAGLSPAQCRRLQEVTLSSAARMAYLEQRLEALLALYDSQGIRVLLLKGAALAVTVYHSFSARPMADLDLLVDRDRAQEAWELARGAGWTGTVTDQQRLAYQEHQHLRPLDDARGTGLGLELHTDLLPKESPFAFGAEALWRDAVPIEVAGRPGFAPADVDLLLHLCIHFAWSHALVDAAWRTFRDIQALITAGRVDWQELARRARPARASTSVYWTLRLGCRLSGLAVPEGLLDELRPPAGEPLLRPVERYFCTVLCRPPDWQDRTILLGRTLWRLGIRPGWSGHGAARPWRRDELFAWDSHESDDAEPAPPAGARILPPRWRQVMRELRALAP